MTTTPTSHRPGHDASAAVEHVDQTVADTVTHILTRPARRGSAVAVLADELTGQLAALDADQEAARDDCAGIRVDSVAAALLDARSNLDELGPDSDLLPGITAVVGDARRELDRALEELDLGHCGHTCPPIPTDRATVERVTAGIVDRLTAEGWQLTRPLEGIDDLEAHHALAAAIRRLDDAEAVFACPCGCGCEGCAHLGPSAIDQAVGEFFDWLDGHRYQIVLAIP